MADVTQPRDYLDNIEAAEFQNEDSNVYVGSHLEFEKWKIDPEAKKNYVDINKDSVLGNLDKAEMITLRMLEQTYVGGVAIYSQLPPTIRDYFLPVNQVFAPSLRKKDSMLALSNSKDGFRLKIIASKLLFKTTTENKDTEKKKLGSFNFLNKKKDKEEE